MTQASASKTDPYLTEADQFSAYNYKPLPVVLERGEGAWVWDVDGNRYLDMLSAGGRLRHKELLAPFGLDASDPDFWRRGMNTV